MLPTDPAFQQLARNPNLLAFTAHWLRKTQEEWWDRTARFLGVLWTREEVARMNQPGSGQTDECFIPLSLGVNPGLFEQLQSIFHLGSKLIGQGEYQPGAGEEVVEMSDMSPDEFKSWAAQALGAAPAAAEPVTLTTGDGAVDPRAQKIQEQIAASKRF